MSAKVTAEAYYQIREWGFGIRFDWFEYYKGVSFDLGPFHLVIYK